MEFWGVVDVFQQWHLIKEQQGLIRKTYVHPLKLRRITQFRNRYSSKNVKHNYGIGRFVSLIEASVVINTMRLSQIVAFLQGFPENSSERTFAWNFSINSNVSCNSAIGNSLFVGSVDKLGGYIEVLNNPNWDDDGYRYVCLRELVLCLEKHEMQSMLLFLRHISDSVANYDFPYGACTFEYIYWQHALKECCLPAFNVIVTPPDNS